MSKGSATAHFICKAHLDQSEETCDASLSLPLYMSCEYVYFDEPDGWHIELPGGPEPEPEGPIVRCPQHCEWQVPSDHVGPLPMYGRWVDQP